MKKRISILGFGSVGQAIVERVFSDAAFSNKFEIYSIWNRSSSVFEKHKWLKSPGHREITIHNDLEALISDLTNVDLVVECAHSNILLSHGTAILNHSDLFISSPTAFANEQFQRSIEAQLKATKKQCFIPLGASVGIWDVIRLDQTDVIESLSVTMSKDPTAFKISDDIASRKILQSIQQEKDIVIAQGNVREMNNIAPQNTNTMSVYALAASQLGFDSCTGKLIGNPQLESHIVECTLKMKSGLIYAMKRDNPAKKGAVTGSATFNSFLTSLKNYDQGIRHGHYTFC